VSVFEAAEEHAGWNVNRIQEFPDQGTLESWPFGILGPPIFVLDWILCVLPAVKAEREYICAQDFVT